MKYRRLEMKKLYSLRLNDNSISVFNRLLDLPIYLFQNLGKKKFDGENF